MTFSYVASAPVEEPLQNKYSHSNQHTSIRVIPSSVEAFAISIRMPSGTFCECCLSSSLNELFKCSTPSSNRVVYNKSMLRGTKLTIVATDY